MPDPSQNEAPFGDLPFLGRYLVVLVLTIFVVVAAGWALSLAGVPIPPGAAAIFPPIAAALQCGQHWGRTRGVVPDTKLAWRWAVVAALVYLVLLLVLALPFIAPMMATLMPILVTLLGGTVLMTILINRFFVVIGARSGVAQGKRG